MNPLTGFGLGALLMLLVRKRRRTYRLTAGAESWTWSAAELHDTLYESVLWESLEPEVEALAVGQELVSGAETLRRLT